MDENSNLGVLLVRAYDWFDEALLRRMHAAGYAEMTRPHSLIYSYLEASGSRPAELARRIGISRQAVHATLTEMAARGLVELIPDPSDQRGKLVSLTPRGSETVAAARAILSDLEAELAERIGTERVLAMRDALGADWGPPLGPD